MSNEDPIVVEHTYSAPVDRVWRAITHKDEMPKWFFEGITDFRAEVGFDTKFDVTNEGKVYPHHWRVTEVVPHQRIAYDWLYTGFPGSSVVKWELSKLDDGTRLKLTHTGVWSFPQDDKAFQRDSCEGGWKYFLDRLEKYLAAQ